MSDVTLKEYFEKILEAERTANDQRFAAQEKAIATAEHSRDVAIKKAEDSIEKKSDAVYVKFTGLQKTLTEVMFRPEVESRLKAITDKIDDLKESRATTQGKGVGRTELWGLFVVGVGVVGGLIAIFSRLNF